jgi:hypothetical protein
LRSDHLLVAPNYSERRSELAKSLGLGRKSTAQATPEVSPPAAPTPVDVDQGSEAKPTRRRSRAASKSAEGGHEVVAEPKPARKRRPRSQVTSPEPAEIPSSSLPS